MNHCFRQSCYQRTISVAIKIVAELPVKLILQDFLVEQMMIRMEIKKETTQVYKQKYNTRFAAYLRIIHLQFDLMQNKNVVLGNASFAEAILQLEIQKRNLVKQITDFIGRSAFRVGEIAQIEEKYELLLRGIATASLTAY